MHRPGTRGQDNRLGEREEPQEGVRENSKHQVGILKFQCCGLASVPDIAQRKGQGWAAVEWPLCPL